VVRMQNFSQQDELIQLHTSANHRDVELAALGTANELVYLSRLRRARDYLRVHLLQYVTWFDVLRFIIIFRQRRDIIFRQPLEYLISTYVSPTTTYVETAAASGNNMTNHGQ
jgi:hypothetical protein